MNWDAIGAIGEIIGALAVLATLFYLAIQIRQNTRTVQTSTYQAALESSNKFNELVLNNSELHRIYRLGRNDPSQLTDEERARFRLLLGHLINVYETMFLQYERGTLDLDFWQARQQALALIISQPGIHSYLETRVLTTNVRVASFRKLIISLLDQPPLKHDPGN